MSDLNGVDLGGLDNDWGGGGSLPPIDPKLVHLCDADFGCYQVADLEKTDVENYQDLLEWIDYRRLLCGAGRSIPVVTCGTKGGRYELSVAAEYQGKRKKHRDPELSNRVHSLRHLLGERDGRAVASFDQEADDVICQIQMASLRGTGDPRLKEGERCITDSDDKDLRMFPGLHLCPDTLERVDVVGYGSCRLVETPSGKKAVGWGTSFFWHQMLMGDSADNIPGLPMLSGTLANRYSPTAAVTKALGRIADGGTEKQLSSAQRTLRDRKPLKCGPVLAYAILEGCENDFEAMRRVRDAYYSWYGPGSFELQHWRGHTVRVTAGHMMLEQARLLWMRRVPRECPTTFFKEVIAKYGYDKEVPW